MPTATELLDFEEACPRWSGRKDEANRARFAITPPRYSSCYTARSTTPRCWPPDRCLFAAYAAGGTRPLTSSAGARVESDGIPMG